MRAPLLFAAALAARRLREQRPDRQHAECRREPDRREYRLQRRDRDRRGHRRRRQHGRRRRHELRQSRRATTPRRRRTKRADSRRRRRPPASAPPPTPRRTRRRTPRPTPNRLKAARRPCAPAASGATSAAPSPARSPPRAPRSRSSQSIGCTRKWSKSQLSSSAGSIPSCGHTSLSSFPLRWTTSVPGLGADADPVDARRPPAASRWSPTAIRKPRACSASTSAVSSCSIGSPPVITTSRRSAPSPHSAST